MSWAIAFAAISAAFQFGGSMAQAKSVKRASKLEAAQMDEQKAIIKLQATQEEADRLQKLRILEASNRAGVGYDFTASTSFMALELANEVEAERDIARIKTNAASQKLQVVRAKQQTLDKGRAQAAGIRMKAFGNLFGSAASISKMGGSGGETGTSEYGNWAKSVDSM